MLAEDNGAFVERLEVARDGRARLRRRIARVELEVLGSRFEVHLAESAVGELERLLGEADSAARARSLGRELGSIERHLHAKQDELAVRSADRESTARCRRLSVPPLSTARLGRVLEYSTGFGWRPLYRAGVRDASRQHYSLRRRYLELARGLHGLRTRPSRDLLGEVVRGPALAYEPMVAAMSRLTGPVSMLAEISRMADENLGTWLREYEGYRGILVLADEDASTTRLITLWETAVDEERARTSRGAMRDQLAATAGVEVVEFGVFEVLAFEVLTEPAEGS